MVIFHSYVSLPEGSLGVLFDHPFSETTLQANECHLSAICAMVFRIGIMILSTPYSSTLFKKETELPWVTPNLALNFLWSVTIYIYVLFFPIHPGLTSHFSHMFSIPFPGCWRSPHLAPHEVPGAFARPVHRRHAGARVWLIRHGGDAWRSHRSCHIYAYMYILYILY